jgi:hypothetical protein
MANQLSVLSSFTHITQEISGIRAIISVQYPELSTLQSLSDSLSRVLGQKRAVYLAITDSAIWHIHTVGNKIVKKTAIEANTIDEIQTSNTTLSGERDVKLPTVNITTKHITYKTVKEKVEEKTEKKTVVKTIKKQVEVPIFQKYDFTLFPVTFLANLKYNQNVNEVLQSVEMRQMVMNYLQKLQTKIADKKLIEQFKAQEMAAA